MKGLSLAALFQITSFSLRFPSQISTRKNTLSGMMMFVWCSLSTIKRKVKNCFIKILQMTVSAYFKKKHHEYFKYGSIHVNLLGISWDVSVLKFILSVLWREPFTERCCGSAAYGTTSGSTQLLGCGASLIRSDYR